MRHVSKFLFILTILISFASNAQSQEKPSDIKRKQDWVYVMEGSDGSTWYAKHVNTSGNVKTVWLKNRNTKVVMELDSDRKSVMADGSTLQKIEFNCKKKRARTTFMASYDDSGKSLLSADKEYLHFNPSGRTSCLTLSWKVSLRGSA